MSIKNCSYELTIVPLDRNSDIDRSGWIRHGEINETHFLELIGVDVRNLCQMESFTPTWAYIITYFENRPNMMPYPRTNDEQFEAMSNLKNTFQVLLVTNGNDSFAFYRYVKMEWPNNLFQYNNINAGFYFDDYTNHRMDKYFIKNNSLSNLVENSNMGITGRWFINFNNDNCRFNYTYDHKPFDRHRFPPKTNC